MVKSRKGMLAVVLCVVMLAGVVSGCGENETTDGNMPDSQKESVETDSGDGQTPDQTDGTAMGRYLEEVTDMSYCLSGNGNGVYRLSDTRLVLTDSDKPMQVSADSGVTWEEEQQEWLNAIRQEGVVREYGIGPDGTAAIVYMKMSPDEGSTAVEELRTDTRYAVLLVRPDGTQTDVRLPDQECSPSHVWIADDGRIFLGTDGVDLYEVMEDGTCKLYLTLEVSPQIIRFVGSHMVIDGYDLDELLIYDMEQRAYVEDDVLADFVHDNFPYRSFSGGRFYDLFFFGGEDDVLYLASENGLYRHVLGGTAMEQVIDGNLTTFGNPAYKLISMTRTEDNAFIAVFTDARLVRFVYDPDVPTVPSEKIRAYSLKENSTLRQAISLYQTANPNVYVEYVVGMSESDAVTKDDAIKRLNTEIVAGEGPDLLILDDLPTASYIEKGLLRDLSPLLDSLSGEEVLFDNIVDSFRKDGKVYMIPCDINLPVLLGREQDIAGVENLKDFADCVEKVRQEHPEEDILAVASARGIMRLLTPVCAPAWTAADGTVDQTAVSDFLTQTKRVYEAQMDGLSEKSKDRWQEAENYYMTHHGISYEDYDYFNYGVSELEYMVGYKQMMIGTVGAPAAYAELITVPQTKGWEDNIFQPLSGQCGNVFYADTLVGINAASRNMAHAEGLLKTLAGADMVSGTGFQLNRAAFEKCLYPEEYESEFKSFSSVGFGDGVKSFYLDVYWYGKTLENRLWNWMETVNTPYIRNDLLEEAVYAAGTDYFEERISLEEAVAEVEKSMAIYLAE